MHQHAVQVYNSSPVRLLPAQAAGCWQLLQLWHTCTHLRVPPRQLSMYHTPLLTRLQAITLLPVALKFVLPCVHMILWNLSHISTCNRVHMISKPHQGCMLDNGGCSHSAPLPPTDVPPHMRQRTHLTWLFVVRHAPASGCKTYYPAMHRPS